MSSSAPLLCRRQLLRLGLGTAGLLALPAALGGCSRESAGAELLHGTGALPAGWLRQLPRGWRAQALPEPMAISARLEADGGEPPAPALVALADGWATALPPQSWRPLEAPELLAALTDWAQPAARLFAAEGQPAVAFPWSFSPWVLALRSRPALAERAAEGWDLLLDPSLRGKLVLPSSPRVCVELMGRDFERIQALRRQPLAYDDRNALNLLLAGGAEAAVVPLRPLIPLLRRDPRLAVVLPPGGAPLSWQLLLRPAAAEPVGRSEAPPIKPWMAEALEPPLLNNLLLGGWVPPLPRPLLAPLVTRFPEPIASLLLPPDAVLERCWSLAPLTVAERLAMQTVWDAAAPAS
ncbi:twin-arginine translocation pathway signal [Cyanobium sp. ATX 6A2]|uniref:twin-arginine translocation pathway signal n=1 Tax=Cyanobium sp. ATX 6A2 TaxID=2823700 RepID=UPI0020CCF315|nr:twin-arginine translocation pathway signal [Cyanobium sp. ATX 6A2]MCP9886592.1 twin-arginine translocation pathway signal [Cyanobium sp. ATX 6A2]